MVRLSPLAVSAVLFASASAFVPSSLPISRSAQGAVSTPTTLYNVPPPSTEDPASLKESSDRERPPASFFELQINSARAAQLAIDAGERFIEVEFPPLPAQVLEMDDVSAYDVAKANIELAIDFAKSFAANQKKVTIMLPDEAEAKIAVENLGTDTPAPNVRVSSLRKSDEDDERVFKPDQLFLNLFGTGSGGAVKAVEGTDMYIIIVASAQELPDVEELSELDPGKTIVFYNLKLDVLRGDLGAPAFPGKVKQLEVVEKYHLERLFVFLYTHHMFVSVSLSQQDFQDRFLSKVKPVYYLRTRQYSRSTSRRPFMVNYQGCLFRSYPGQFQTLLDTGNGKYRRVKGSTVRPALGEFKEELTDELKRQGVIDEEGKTLNFLRTGYKTTTWWEEEREEASDIWKT